LSEFNESWEHYIEQQIGQKLMRDKLARLWRGRKKPPRPIKKDKPQSYYATDRKVLDKKRKSTGAINSSTCYATRTGNCRY
jgi:hypothetical protein